jgi:uncharacterized protein YjiS (DUF1127 family)
MSGELSGIWDILYNHRWVTIKGIVMNSNHGEVTMEFRRHIPIRHKRSAGPVAALFQSLRRSRAHSRNLAALGALDGFRLQDIGFSEHERALIVRASRPSVLISPSGRFGRFAGSGRTDHTPKLDKGKIR